MAPYNVFVPRAPLPKAPPPLGRIRVARGESVSADSTGTRASLFEGGTVKSDVNEEPGMGPADRSLTAAGGSAVSSLTAAGGSDQTVVDVERINAEDASARWPIGDEKFAAWLSHNSGQPDPPFVAPVQQPPGSWPRLQSEGSCPVYCLPSVASQQLTVSILGIHRWLCAECTPISRTRSW